MPRIAIIVDSNCMLPPELAAKHGIRVIPLPVMIDNDAYLEGVDLDTDDFYRRLAAGATVTTSQPSPGEIVAHYRQAVDDGAEAIVSVHVAKHLSGTINSARIAAQGIDIPVELIDTGTASFPIGLSALATAEAAENGSTLEQCVAAAMATIAEPRNVFVLSELDFVRVEGRFRVDSPDGDVKGIPVVAMHGEDLTVVGDARDIAHASDLMVDVVARQTAPCRVGIGVGGREAFDFYGTLRSRLERLDNVAEIIDYRCGPSVGAYSGPGVAGMAWALL